jgi:hypothetical protein
MRKLIYFAALTLTTSWGCKSDDDAGSGGQALSELTSAELDALCDELHGYALRTWNGACTQEALENANASTESCATARQSCLADSAGDCSARAALAAGTADCKNVDVSDLRSCLIAAASANEQLYGVDVDCESGLKPAEGHPSKLPSSCERVLEHCAGLAGDIGADGESEGGAGSDPQPPELGDGPCLSATEVASILGLTLMTHSSSDRYCEYGPQPDTTSVYIRYSLDVVAEDFTAEWSTKTTAKPLAGLGDQAYYIESLPGAQVSTMLVVLSGTTRITIAAPAERDKVVELMRVLLAKL